MAKAGGFVVKGADSSAKGIKLGKMGKESKRSSGKMTKKK